MGAGLEVMDGMHAGQRQGVGCMSEDAGTLPDCEVMTPDRTAILMCSSG